MLAHSPRDRSRSPHTTNGMSNPIESTENSKTKKESESQQRTRSLKSFIQTLIKQSPSIGTRYDEQVQVLERACMEEYQDLSIDRIRRMIRSVLKVRKTHPSTASPFLHHDRTNITNDRLNSNENNSKKSRSNSLTNTKTLDLIPSSLSAFDADFLRQAFSQQFRPSMDLSAYFSTPTASNGNNPTSSLFRSNYSPSNFLQALTNTTPLALPPTLIASHTHTNGTTKSSNQVKLSNPETTSLKILVNAYREAASYLCRSADELEQLI